MENGALRILLGLIAAFMLAYGLAVLFALDTIKPVLALATTSDLGRANIRADVGGVFITSGFFAGIAAIYRHQQAALAGALLFFIALSGRFVSLAFEGMVAGGAGPMLVEAIFGSVLLFASKVFKA